MHNGTKTSHSRSIDQSTLFRIHDPRITPAAERKSKREKWQDLLGNRLIAILAIRMHSNLVDVAEERADNYQASTVHAVDAV